MPQGMYATGFYNAGAFLTCLQRQLKAAGAVSPAFRRFAGPCTLARFLLIGDSRFYTATG
ncbi:hypothetical protein EGI32_08795 [Ferruginibacter sp. HRS2-29]|nr:hypothetical protein [Ferruginibacter sp. HRS2-29]